MQKLNFKFFSKQSRIFQGGGENYICVGRLVAFFQFHMEGYQMEKKSLRHAGVLALATTFAITSWGGFAQTASASWATDLGAIIGSAISKHKTEKAEKQAGHSREGFTVVEKSKMTTNQKMFIQAVEHGDTGMAREMLDTGVNINTVYTNNLGTAFFRARGNREMEQFLLENGTNVNGFPYKFYNKVVWYSYLNFAVNDGDFDEVVYIHNWGADINLTGAYSTVFNDSYDDNVNALQCLVAKVSLGFLNRNLDLAKYLIAEGIDVNHRDSRGKTALFYLAESCEDDESVKTYITLLLEAGADPNIKLKNGNTAYDYFVSKNKYELAKYLRAEIARLGL